MEKYSGELWPGKPYPLGSTWDGDGVNFALFSENAKNVTLCLFDSIDENKEIQIEINEVTDFVWHVYVPGIKPGQLYGYRVHGPFNPKEGWRFNENKLLIDPYTKAINGSIKVQDNMFGYPLGTTEKKPDLLKDSQNNGTKVNKCIVIDPSFDWENDFKPGTSMHNTIIYELHVKGFTWQHPELPPEIKGTYKGLSHPVIIDYFKNLGITAIELMPTHHFLHRKNLLNNGLRNYWGYDSIGYFAPHAEYCSSGMNGEQVSEFKEMVKAYHKAGIEVLLDVVYNHTGEGDHMGPTLSFRGIDNEVYYRLKPDKKRLYQDYTGTGNSLNMLNSRTLQLVMDSLRYWITEMHVDGFRFDLASTLARGLHDVGKLSTFLDTIHQDPIISQVKLIAEPWDLGEGGYQVGNFPILWAEWNGKYRDCVRQFWRGDESQVAELAYRLSGSSDLYQNDGRLPYASINFITSHDGFTLNDLVSYNEKHNEANMEDNKDGNNHNISFNFGVEGPTDDQNIINLRDKQKRNFLATLMFSQGVPMISHGDEYGRTQHGNNNAYCHDNETAWFKWNWDDKQQQLFEFTRNIIKIRHNQPVLHRRRYFKGREIHGTDIRDIRWLQPNGTDMTSKQWKNDYTRCMGMMLNGELMDEVDEKGKPIQDDILLLIVNSFWESIDFKLPANHVEWEWELLVDTFKDTENSKNTPINNMITIHERSLILLKKIS